METKTHIYSCLNCGRKNMGDYRCDSCLVEDNDMTSVPTEWIPENEEDNVNHPKHYQTKSGLETIDVIEAFCDGINGIEAVCTANVIKYICRWKKKNGLEDLKKANWYLNKLINTIEKESK